MLDYNNFSDSIRSVFLLFIAISANFLGNTLNCGIQFDLTTTPLLRNIFLYILIVFTTDFASKKSMSVGEILSKSLIIYIFYIMLSKQDYITIYIIIILLIATYLCYLQTNYLKDNNKNYNFYDELTSFLIYGIGIVTVIGFLMYFSRQYNDNKDDFDMTKFIFGTNKCDKLKTL
jgi:hypothetical protein